MLHSQRKPQERKLVDNQLDSLGERHAASVACARLDANQNGIRASLRGLHGRGEFEAVRGEDAIVVIGG